MSTTNDLRERVARLEERLAALVSRVSSLESERTWLVRLVLGAVSAAVLGGVIVLRGGGG